MADLLPCPFCGGVAAEYGESLIHSIHCTGCRAGLSMVAGNVYDGIEEVCERLRAAWNTRTPAPKEAPSEASRGEVSAPGSLKVTQAKLKATQAVLLNLLDQVRKFCAEQGEADFETGAAEAMRRHIRGTPVDAGLQRQLDTLLDAYGTPGTPGGGR